MSLLMTKNIDLLPGINFILDEAREKLKQLTGTDVFITISDDPKELNSEALQHLVCKEFGVSWNQIAGKKRDVKYVDARTAYCYLSNSVLRKTKVSIAMELNRHHTSVVHLVNRANDQIETGDLEFIKKIDTIETKIRRSYESTKH